MVWCFPTAVSPRPPRRSPRRTHSPGPAGALETTTTPRPQTLLALPWGAGLGPSRAESRHGHLYLSTGFPGCTETRPERFPVLAGWGRSRPRTRTVIGTGIGTWGGAWVGAEHGRGEGGVVTRGRGLCSGAIKARPAEPLLPPLAPPCASVCVCVCRLPASIPAAPQLWRR